MQYFESFPTILYSFDPSTGFQLVTNIFARVKFLDKILSNTLVYYPYSVQDGDTAWSIADKYYDDPQRHWIVYFAQQLVDPYFDWPLTQKDLDNNIVARYGSIANAQATLDHIEQQAATTVKLNGVNTTNWSNTTLNSAFTYDFSSRQVQAVTLPSIGTPLIDKGTITYSTPDGSVVTTHTQWVAVDAYTATINNNERKRQIRLIDKSYVKVIEDQLTTLLAQ
jgi:hypothetical protein